MLSYRHSFHAGNHADVLKHIIQIEVLEHLIKKDSPFDYIDTHAGAGLYNLQSEHATKLQEYTQGVAKLNSDEYPELATYFDILSKQNTSGKLNFYPGSPLIATSFLRKKDRGWLYELHPKDAELLLKNTANRKNIRVM
ncbi:MAG: 23S rRNA (adenine(2030)-N(6))-methyltransferase RlmJ, partial [Gammaproteobacteria bacterium]|nr:23S rRNA (adenine(2030)-N(6))-methyltransferase RlmJ [Gammaproteobacteria bacterium]